MNPIAISAIHQFHEKNNAILTSINGWMMPKRYVGIKDELEIVENFVGIHDISSKVKLILNGDDVFQILSEKAEVISELNRKVMLMRSFEYGFVFILAELTKNQHFILAEQQFKDKDELKTCWETRNFNAGQLRHVQNIIEKYLEQPVFV